MFHTIATVVASLSLGVTANSQGLPSHWNNVRSSWENALEAGDGKKVQQEAEVLLNRSDIIFSLSNYNDAHAKVAILSIAARGAVLDGDWPGAVTLLSQAVSTAQANFSLTTETLDNLRKQHQSKIDEWTSLVQTHEERLKWLKEQPGLRSEQIQEVSYLESFISEHNRAIASSKKSIDDIDGILSTLKAEEETCTKSLNDWNGFLMKERLDIQELGSQQRYVAEKFAQVKGDTFRSRFELISYTRRLIRLDPANQECQKYLTTLLNSKPTK
ncbi:MAG: hypothetical protein FWG02_03235 [Holophagaceae bacterium]|nr:hypothetical protein [Holophagaceae bacterium]